MTAVPAGSGFHAVLARGIPEARIWPAFAVDFLMSCAEFRPLGEQVRRYARYHALDTAQVREVGHWAERMIESGLLITAGRVVERCVSAGGPAGEAARIGSVGIPSSGNPDRLRRVLSTFARNALARGRALEFEISANGPGGPAAAALLREIAREEGVKIALLDDAARTAYAAALAARAGVEARIVEFALGDPLGAGFAAGANRNALLLRNSGRAYLSLDDDVACELAAAPEQAAVGGLAVFSSRDGFERWFYPGYAETFERQVPARDVDYLGLHESMLGGGVGALMAAEPDIEFLGVSDEMLSRMTETDGRIVATFTGHYGHPGIPTTYYCLSYRGETLARLTRGGEARYRACLASGGVFAAVPRRAIADASLSPGMAIGIDARTLIPPFPPVMHAEDFVWGAAVWQCVGAGFAGHLPIAVRHDPGIGRGILAPPLEGEPVAIWEFAHILRGLLLKWMPPPGMSATADRMDALGRFLCDIGGAPEREFLDHLRSFVLQHESDKIAFLEQCLEEEEEAPDFWRRDVEAYIEMTRLALSAPGIEIPFEMRGKWAPDQARRVMQEMVLGYGRLLRAWPALMTAARSL